MGADVEDIRAVGSRRPGIREILQGSSTGNPPVFSRDIGNAPPGLGGT